MDVRFQRDYYDSDGDLVEPCLILWFDSTFALKIDRATGVQDLIARLQKIDDEIHNSYPRD